MLLEREIQRMLIDAESAANFAIEVRETHRKRTTVGSKAREGDIRVALNRLKAAMRPIRSALAQSTFRTESPVTPLQAKTLKEASEILQRERRKLWKMQKRSRRRNKGNQQRRRGSEAAGPRTKKDG